MDERGSVGMAAMLAVGVICACALGALALIGGTIGYGRRIDRERSLMLELRAAARGVLDELARDATPESDGPRDKVWTLLGTGPEGIGLGLADASSRIDPNLVSAELIEKTELRSLLAPGITADALVAYRNDKGLSADVRHYAGIFADSALPELGCFGWANLNTDDPAALRLLFLSLTGDPDGADAFSARLGAARSAKGLIGGGELRAFLGSAYGKAFPAISAEAPYNVNFASPELIRSILSYPPFGIPDPKSRAEAIVSARGQRDLGPLDIAALCGTATSGPILQYLGSRTWFWTARAAGSGRRLSITVAVWPEGGTTERIGAARRLSVIETRFEP